MRYISLLVGIIIFLHHNINCSSGHLDMVLSHIAISIDCSALLFILFIHSNFKYQSMEVEPGTLWAGNQTPSLATTNPDPYTQQAPGHMQRLACDALIVQR